jgi:hypothetical protein
MVKMLSNPKKKNKNKKKIIIHALLNEKLIKHYSTTAGESL